MWISPSGHGWFVSLVLRDSPVCVFPGTFVLETATLRGEVEWFFSNSLLQGHNVEYERA